MTFSAPYIYPSNFCLHATTIILPPVKYTLYPSPGSGCILSPWRWNKG